jgi:adenylyl- and sulfurtransferase ThiI
MTNQPTIKSPAPDIILIRYGEIYLKSSYVRNQFEHTLMNNIHHHCTVKSLPAAVTRDRGRLYLQTHDIPQALTILNNIFGIISFSPAITTSSIQKDITSTALQLIQPHLTTHTSFALRVTRTGSHPYTSQDIAIQVGNAIVTATQAPVNLTKPDIELFIEIRHKHAYLFTQKLSGPGGLPLGTQGHALILIDTPQAILAAWYLMRRGCTPHFILTSTKYQNILTSFLTKWHSDTNTSVHLTTPDSLYADINHQAQSHTCDAIITGLTLTNEKDLNLIQNYKTNLTYPVLHPLIAMTPTEIQRKAMEVGLCL